MECANDPWPTNPAARRSAASRQNANICHAATCGYLQNAKPDKSATRAPPSPLSAAAADSHPRIAVPSPLSRDTRLCSGLPFSFVVVNRVIIGVL